MHVQISLFTGITLTSLLASEKTVTVEAEVKEKRWWLKGSTPVEVATEIITFLRNMTKVNYYKLLKQTWNCVLYRVSMVVDGRR